jgi:hypothetical protein
MKKKIIISIGIVLFLIIAGGGFFWWWEGREIKGSPTDYIIKETGEGKIIENKRAGLTVKVPEGWETRKMGAEEGLEEGAIVFYSPNTEVELREGKKNLPLEKGCLIHVKLIYEKLNFAGIKMEARYTHSIWGVKTEEFEEITINNYLALKNIFDTHTTGPGMGIYIPRDDKIYWINLFWAINEKESCSHEFDKFLDTVSIR